MVRHLSPRSSVSARRRGDTAVLPLYTRILRAATDPPAERPGQEDYELDEVSSEGGEGAPLGAVSVGAVLAGVPLPHEPSSQPPLENFGPGPSDPTACRLRYVAATGWCGVLSSALSVAPADLYVTQRSLAMPVGFDGEMSLVDVRWADVRDLCDLSSLVPADLYPQRHRWIGLVLLADTALVVPLPAPLDSPERALEGFSLPIEGSLWTGPAARDPDYGVFFDSEAGRVWAIREGHRLPHRALVLLPDGGSLPDVALELPSAIRVPPPAGLWEVPRDRWRAVQREHSR